MLPEGAVPGTCIVFGRGEMADVIIGTGLEARHAISSPVSERIFVAGELVEHEVLVYIHLARPETFPTHVVLHLTGDLHASRLREIMLDL